HRVDSTTRRLLEGRVFSFSAAGTPCRFDNSSTTRGTCIFPCRCTDGCDQVTGQCLDGGQCSDGHPSGYKWSGPACQIGNIALYKNASQSPSARSDKFLASKAVDGNIDPWSGCALQDDIPGDIIWWNLDFGGSYKLSRVIIYNGNTECNASYFGWRCRFRCHKCPTCDSITGKCPSTCQDNRWGVGCMLSSDCYYDDDKGNNYMGRESRGYHSHGGTRTCIPWIHQTHYPDSSFPDGSRSAANNYCRTVDVGSRPWCYYNSNSNWAYCRVNHCQCEDGHFGVFCDGTCHCSSGSCDKTTGHCPGGCATGWSGDSCQIDERRLSAFTLSVGNSSDMNDHTQCASHNGAVAAGATVNESCTATGRYLSIRVNGEDDTITLCEMVVIGHRYI
ncbi:hypothetical protein NP493_1314g00024, partial [Ridgeia piscesae]